LFFSAESFHLHYFNPKLLAVTHLAVLGWISNVIFGALNQLLPVLTLSPLYSTILPRIAFIMYNLGVAFLVYGFYYFDFGTLMILGVVFLVLSVLMIFANIYITIHKSEEKGIELDFISTSVFWLFVTVLIGTFMVVNFIYPFISTEHLTMLKLHAHIGLAGWFVLLIFGVASKLMPMFLLSPDVKKNKLKLSYAFINVALVLLFADVIIFCTLERSLIYFSIALIGVISFMTHILEVYKKRVRKIPDIGMKQSLVAIALIFIPLIIGFVFNSGVFKNEFVNIKMNIAYLTTLIFGFISLLIFGQTYKILPFIVWMHKYSGAAGKSKTLLPKDLYSEMVAKAHFAIFVLAFPLFVLGIMFHLEVVFQVAIVLFILVAILYNYNIFKICFSSGPKAEADFEYGRA